MESSIAIPASVLVVAPRRAGGRTRRHAKKKHRPLALETGNAGGVRQSEETGFAPGSVMAWSFRSGNARARAQASAASRAAGAAATTLALTSATRSRLVVPPWPNGMPAAMVIWSPGAA